MEQLSTTSTRSQKYHQGVPYWAGILPGPYKEVDSFTSDTIYN